MTRPRPSPTLLPYTTLFRSSVTSCPPAAPNRRSVKLPVDSSVTVPVFVSVPTRIATELFSTLKRPEVHTSELLSHHDLVCRLLPDKESPVRVPAPDVTSKTP